MVLLTTHTRIAEHTQMRQVPIEEAKWLGAAPAQRAATLILNRPDLKATSLEKGPPSERSKVQQTLGYSEPHRLLRAMATARIRIPRGAGAAHTRGSLCGRSRPPPEAVGAQQQPFILPDVTFTFLLFFPFFSFFNFSVVPSSATGSHGVAEPTTGT